MMNGGCMQTSCNRKRRRTKKRRLLTEAQSAFELCRAGARGAQRVQPHPTTVAEMRKASPPLTNYTRGGDGRRRQTKIVPICLRLRRQRRP